MQGGWLSAVPPSLPLQNAAACTPGTSRRLNTHGFVMSAKRATASRFTPSNDTQGATSAAMEEEPGATEGSPGGAAAAATGSKRGAAQEPEAAEGAAPTKRTKNSGRKSGRARVWQNKK